MARFSVLADFACLPCWASPPRLGAHPASDRQGASTPTRRGSQQTVGWLFALGGSALVTVLLTGPSTVAAHPALVSHARAQLATAPFALLSTKRMLSYPYEHVWPASIRYLRVDRGFKIADKDEEAGYIMFEFTSDDGESGSGSLELVRTEDAAGRPSTSLVAITNGGPSYLSNSLLDGVAAKVREERGAPAAPPKKAPPEPPPAPPEIDPDGPKGEEPGFPPGPAPKEKGRKGRK